MSDQLDFFCVNVLFCGPFDMGWFLNEVKSIRVSSVDHSLSDWWFLPPPRGWLVASLFAHISNEWKLHVNFLEARTGKVTRWGQAN